MKFAHYSHVTEVFMVWALTIGIMCLERDCLKRTVILWYFIKQSLA